MSGRGDWAAGSVSGPFSFMHWTIELCAGSAAEEHRDRLLHVRAEPLKHGPVVIPEKVSPGQGTNINKSVMDKP
jgi:hypothetical protein